MEKLISQKGTIDEFPISYTLEGNINSKNLLVMIHGGGMDHHEKGKFVGLKNSLPYKEMGPDGKLHTKLFEIPYGNYDRICTELICNNIDTSIVRINLRNHGQSLKDGKMDTRDTSIERMARDISEIVDYLVSIYNYENINLFGTCMGGLVTQCYALGIGKDLNKEDNNRSKIKSLILDCSLSYKNLYTTDKTDKFNYDKCQKILEDNNYKFNKMNGVYEGIDTLKEAQKNGDISAKIGNLNIPILYIYGENDRLISSKLSSKIANNMKKENESVEIVRVSSNDHGFADHCLYDPQSSDKLLLTTIPFVEKQIDIQNNLLNKNKKM